MQHTENTTTSITNEPRPWLIDSYTGEKPTVQLVGMDGNAFSILSRVGSAWKQLHRLDIAKEYRERATAGDYSNLLYISSLYITEPESENEDEEDEDEEDGAADRWPEDEDGDEDIEDGPVDERDLLDYEGVGQ